MDKLTCFTAYDIRGEVGVNLTPEIAWRIGRAWAAWLHPRRVVVGGDVRLSTASLKAALSEGLVASGVDVIDLGLTGTEEVYFATRELRTDGGIQVTASHNPAQYNGMKLVREEARPISSDNGLHAIKRLAELSHFPSSVRRGNIIAYDNRPAWVACIMRQLVRIPARPLRVVVNAGHGAAGPALDAIADALQCRGVQVEFIRLHHQPDGRFPAGVPNPMLEANRLTTQQAVIAHHADFGVAWDGDFDRCFFFDEQGHFVESYYLVALFARHLLYKAPGEIVILDPRLTWNTLETVQACGGKTIISKTGHAFFKARMREEDALYGGEMSGHHYFRDFGYCDSGMIPLVLMLQIIGHSPHPFSKHIHPLKTRFPVSGEINQSVNDPSAVMRSVAEHYHSAEGERDDCDGLSITFRDWRFNLRASSTEPLLRLNVETRGDRALLTRKTDELLTLIATCNSDKEPL